ncbi:HD domain-containing protein [Flavobacteriaceae bacterium]|nr:HD domain-containing protein [Flavobacteriaceae bacterium]
MSQGVKILLHAIDYAAEMHRNQRRKNVQKYPYINHPLRVAYRLSECGVSDINVLVGAILHDAVEDTDATLEDVKKLFGQSVCDLVEEVSDDKSLPKAERKRLQIEHIKNASDGAKLIKLSDKFHNLSSFMDGCPIGWSAIDVQGYFVWSMQVVKGCKGVNKQLEAKLTNLFETGKFFIEDKLYECVPKNINLDVFLEEYLNNLE